MQTNQTEEPNAFECMNCGNVWRSQSNTWHRCVERHGSAIIRPIRVKTDDRRIRDSE